MSTVHKYDWVQLGEIKHPESDKTLILDDVQRNGVKDKSVKIYCNTGYGNPDILRQLINIEKPDEAYTLQTQDFGDGCMRWKMKVDRFVQSCITTFGIH